jgi:hypothetical protein
MQALSKRVLFAAGTSHFLFALLWIASLDRFICDEHDELRSQSRTKYLSIYSDYCEVTYFDPFFF